MQRTGKAVLAVLGTWQLIVLAVGVKAFFTGRTAKEPTLSNAQTEVVMSLLHPSSTDLQRSIAEVTALPHNSLPRDREKWEVEMISALQNGHADEGLHILAEQPDGLVTGEERATLEALFKTPKPATLEIETASKAVRALAEVSYHFGGLEEWCWQLWTQAETMEQRARLAQVLTSFHDEANQTVLSTAALRFGKAANSQSLSKETAGAALIVAANFFHANKRRQAFALYQEVEQMATPASSTWGIAVYNQGLILHQTGYQPAARQTLLRLINSAVNDSDPGASLMETNRNYRHWAANLIADTYHADHAFLLAYVWRARAGERYRFHSWCGNCNDEAQREISLSMLSDASLAGPFVLLGHLVVHPVRSRGIWFLLLVALALGLLLRRWRNRRSARGLSAALA